MNRWFRDERTKRAEALTIDADYPRGKDAAAVAALYREAGDLWAAVALEVDASHPRTRSDLAIAAVVCWIKAGDRTKADDLCRRMLEEPATLSMRGRGELARMLDRGLDP